ncbi:MAG: RluA family pseudouridine synthase [Butyrivibrio sp.]|nr:RluA family pseudouridine synthase [Butyrivibrio sp.]
MTNLRKLEYKLNSEDAGLTAGNVMRDILGLSAKEITHCKRSKDGVTVLRKDESGNEAEIPVRVIDKLFSGDTLVVRIYETYDGAADIIPSETPVDVVYEDEDLIVLNKPADMVIHPSYAHLTDSLSNALAGYYKRTGQEHVIRTVGRLDRETSGLVIFAKNRHAAAVLSAQNKQMSKRKEYLALVLGIPDVKEGTIDASIERVEGDRMLRKVSESGKRAVTHYKVEEEFDGYSLVRLVLETGRTHQIRVHMAYIGHPLLGDSLYGNENAHGFGIDRAALHAGIITLKHPVTGKELRFEAPVSKDMKRLLK